MKINYTYPVPEKKIRTRRKAQFVCLLVFLALGLASIIVNICVGGKAWSAIACWGLFMVYSLTISPDVIEFNRISQSVKVAVYSCIMLILIDRFLVSGWAVGVVSIVCFAVLIGVCVLLYTDFERQRHNMLPIIIFAVITLVGSLIIFAVQKENVIWQAIVALSLSVAVLIECLIIMKSNFKNEITKIFHVK